MNHLVHDFKGPQVCDCHHPETHGGLLISEPSALQRIRAAGWVVAVHNDYKVEFVLHTFWLFTKGNVCVKGEGKSDEEALAIVEREIRRVKDERQEGIHAAAEWIASSMASMMFGSDSWSLRRRLADVIKSGDWERHLKNEEMRY